jgi:hypothetical protein
MIADRRVHARPYFVEIFALANFLLILLLIWRAKWLVLSTLPKTLLYFGGTLLIYAALGVIIRCIVAAIRGNLRRYVARIRTSGWLTDLVRMVVFGSVVAHTYAWIKLVVPLVHGRSYDQMLWDLDQAMFFGFSPNVLFINLFGHPTVMQVIDWTYARIFFASMTVAFGFFLSEPSRRLRIAFNTGNSVMWCAGAWLYMLIPSIGPAYRFPDLWLPLSSVLPITQNTQRLLMSNYQNVLRLPSGGSGDVQLMLGVAAFPSLHVGFQTFSFLWMRRIWISGQVIFGIFVLAILIGSVVTGWHYLIDGIAGMLLAALSYWIPARMWRVRRWRRLRQVGMT